jgi:hypothetical protein
VLKTMIRSYASALILCLGFFVPNASADEIVGYSYSITGQTADSGCSAGYSLRDNFVSTGGSNSIAADLASFSICDGVPGQFTGGEFLVSDGSGDTLSWTFSGILKGTSAGGGDFFQGMIGLSSETGYYPRLTENVGVF